MTVELWPNTRTVWPSGLRRWLQAPVRKGVGSNPTAVTCLAQSHSFHVPGLHGQLLGDSPAQLQRGTLCTLSLCDGCQTLKPSRPQLDSVPIEVVFEVLTREAEQAGYSSVGRASDCRALQLSDSPWFDSGWPDLHRLAPQAVRSCAASDTEGIRTPAGRAEWISSPSP